MAIFLSQPPATFAVSLKLMGRLFQLAKLEKARCQAEKITIIILRYLCVFIDRMKHSIKAWRLIVVFLVVILPTVARAQKEVRTYYDSARRHIQEVYTVSTADN